MPRVFTTRLAVPRLLPRATCWFVVICAGGHAFMCGGRHGVAFSRRCAWAPCSQSFMSPQAVGPDVDTYMYAFGDLGVTVPWVTTQEQQPPSQLTVKWIEKSVAQMGDTPTSVLHIGDISYARYGAVACADLAAVSSPVYASQYS